MNIKPQQSDQLSQLGELIVDIRICMLTTIDAHQALVSKPMSPLEMCESGNIWFLTDLNTTQAEQLERANLAFSNESKGTYVSIAGHGEIVQDKARIESLWTAFAKPWFPDGVDSPNLVALKFVPDSAEYWDAPHSKIVRTFAMLASIVAAKPVGIGDHGNLNTL